MTGPDLETQLSALPSLSRKELIDRFHAVYRRPPPLRLSNSILALAVAYKLQEQVYGGLRPEVRRALLSTKSPSLAPRAVAGTVLIREWHGREHTVTVKPDSVEYAGQRYRSLTEVAFRITGQKRSGPAFFGLRQSAP